jgi:hypothetical protein
MSHTFVNRLPNSGAVARSATGVLSVLLMTYDTANALGTSDVPYWMGFHNSGMTPKVHNLTGTSNEWGDYGDRSITAATTRTFEYSCNRKWCFCCLGHCV